MLVIGMQDISNKGEAFAQASDANTAANSDSNGSQDPPLRTLTALGTYTVELDWQPKSLGIGNDTTFDVRILDKSGTPLSYKVNYDFTVAGSDLSFIQELYNQTTDENGIGKPVVVQFERPGPIEITVWVNPSNPKSDAQSESATFDMTVAPEFPLAMPILAVTGIIMAAIIFVTRVRRHYNGTTI